jgi:predicted transcriptional regulator
VQNDKTANVTIRIDKQLLRKLRHRAVDENKSLSAWITALLERTVEREASFQQARKRALKRLEQGFSLGGEPLTREQTHAR